MHARQQIRDAVVTALTGLDITGSNVFKTRVHRFEEETLPALSVYTLQEDSERETMGTRAQSRTVSIAVDIAVQQNTTPDDTLDDIAADVEAAMVAAWTGASGIWGSIRNLTLTSTVVRMTGEGEQPTFGMILTYACNYSTLEGAPETIIT